MERNDAGREGNGATRIVHGGAGEAQLAALRTMNPEGQARSSNTVNTPERISNVNVPEGSNNITVLSDHNAVRENAGAPIQAVHVDGDRLKGDPPVIASHQYLCHGVDGDDAWVADLISSGILEARQRRRKIKPRSKDMAVLNEGSVRKTSTE